MVEYCVSIYPGTLLVIKIVLAIAVVVGAYYLGVIVNETRHQYEAEMARKREEARPKRTPPARAPE